ncbi:MAG: BREX-1 system adenine-specific DNA-methyltransferase PglX [Micrococcales bacterium]|nr:BREX-1 system adenine-specific DNA-methyltransferase PglX [Micrococcales bacterium]
MRYRRTQPVAAGGGLASGRGAGSRKPQRRESAATVARLDKAVGQEGRQAVVDRVAYTWFNRIVALRFMDANRYNPVAVVSPASGQAIGQPEVLAEAKAGSVDAQVLGAKAERVIDLLAGRVSSSDPQQEAYRLLLTAHCNHLYASMPFMFERIGDETELLLPADLLSENSIVAKTAAALSVEACADVEVIGWLYQFYISDKKDQVMGGVVASEDIPAATQLFTPDWIVKYMVQNSLGAMWLNTFPSSSLRQQMDYYVEPAKQTDQVQANLDTLTPKSLNPEGLTLVDPASGSGHVLVEAYDLFKAIYLERGYQQRDVARLILEKNLWGLDIDSRAAQLTGFALMMKGRADDRGLFKRGVKLNITTIVDSAGFDSEYCAQGVTLADYGLEAGDLTDLKALFEHATTFGSLIEVPEQLAAKLPALKQLSEVTSQDLFLAEVLRQIGLLVRQGELLAAHYDVVVMNPPYMGSGSMNALLKKFAKDHFPSARSDLFACFIERSYSLAKNLGNIAMVTMQSWMFLSSYQRMRERLLREKTITTMAQIGYNSFPSMNSKIAQATVFSLANHKIVDFEGTFFDLNSAPQSASKDRVFLERDPRNRYAIGAREFGRLPGVRWPIGPAPVEPSLTSRHPWKTWQMSGKA